MFRALFFNCATESQSLLFTWQCSFTAFATCYRVLTSPVHLAVLAHCVRSALNRSRVRLRLGCYCVSLWFGSKFGEVKDVDTVGGGGVLEYFGMV